MGDPLWEEIEGYLAQQAGRGKTTKGAKDKAPIRQRKSRTRKPGLFFP
jgi:hypothetical protein